MKRGEPRQSIYYYELGKRSLKFDMVENIADALEVSIDTLLGIHSFVSGKPKKVKPLPLKWAAMLNLKELPMHGGKMNEEMDRILQDHDVQMFLYGLLIRLKKLSETDRFVLIQLLTDTVGKDTSMDELESISIVSSRLRMLNKKGLIYANRLIEDVSDLPRYRR